MTEQTRTVEIDLNFEHKSHVYGDVTVIQTWTMSNKRPCLVLVPSLIKRHFERVTPYVVSIDNAWMWDETAGDPEDCVWMTMEAVNALGLSATDPATMIRITSIIREHLGDLLMMPPLVEVAHSAVVADAIITDANSGKTRDREISDHVH
ncbi:hypothetical protein [Sagittula salina]|uniref:Uncharacterized protein n=1 Tax=Sagittula salina TaxID=2820268 RepID=A0A940MXH5_9RHOB|nr:hypothetical protein [Sagittula salina]MBP0484664.1 hypothetical protein [Sagittula salina]